MPISLDQYAEDLDARKDLPWPVAPKIDPPKAKPHLARLPVKAVMWTVYGTLLNVPNGELLFEPPPGPLGDFVFENALEKTIKEFKMWNSMSRKPGKPSEYMGELFKKNVATLRLTGGGEAAAEKVWEDIVKKLQQKEYTYDAGTYGSLEEYCRKIAYFFHASLQGAGAYPGAADALRVVADAGKQQGLLADGQSFTFAQLRRCLRKDDPTFEPAHYVRPELRILSAEAKARKPGEAIFKAATAALAAKGIRPAETLHVGSSLARDIAPAKRYGYRTALFAGDKGSLAATGEQLKDPATKPDVMLTELAQVIEVLG
jgi:FMN phosphatase YigB (HAD superfamily)